MPKLSRACGARLADGLAEAQAALAAQGGQLAELKASLASLQAVVAPLQASHAAQSAQIAELVAAKQEAVEEVRRLRARLNVEVAGRAELADEVEDLGGRFRQVEELEGRFDELTERRFEQLHEGLQGARVEAASLRSNIGRINARGAVAQVAAGAESVWLDGVFLGDAGAQELADGIERLHWSDTRERVDFALTDLNLKDAGIESRGAQALAAALAERSAHLPMLSRLVMNSNAIGPIGVAELVAKLWPAVPGVGATRRVPDLYFVDCAFGSAPESLAAVFCGKAKSLWLSSNGLGAACVQRAAPALAKNRFLRELCLHDNDIGDDGAEALATALRCNSVLSYLDLGSNGITATGARALARALARPGSALEVLKLSSNRIGELGAEAIAEVLAPSSGSVLAELYLDASNVGARGARSLAAALGANRALKKLSLARGNIGDVGARALAAALGTNRSLESLDLSGSGVGADGVAALLAALGACRSIRELALEGNGVEGNGVGTAAEQCLADRLRLNRLARRLPAWVEDAVGNLIELPGKRALPPALVARVGILAFGLELVPCDGWLSAEGRAFANDALLPLAEAALLADLQRLAASASTGRC
jgi:Ran GTPase-activating protein (RanGAP) involved in mRNA processing and transport